jgi:hypothetical protein
MSAIAALFSLAAMAAPPSPPWQPTCGSDYMYSGGAGETSNPVRSIRSGDPGQHTGARLMQALRPGVTVKGVSFRYSYLTGYGPSGVGANFTVRVAGMLVYSSPQLTDYPYSANRSGYSPPIPVVLGGLSIVVPSAGAASHVALEFYNNDRNVQLALPLAINLTCADGASCCSSAAPVQVFMEGDVDDHNVSYGCFRIPQLLALPSGTLLAFAEGRVDGCRPDVNVNRPIVVRASRDEGMTWGEIRIAGPPLANAGTNYPGAYFVQERSSVVLRYVLSNGSVFSTTSTDEGWTWSAPAEASQPPGRKCGSAWPTSFGDGEVVLPCGGGSARSSDGGNTWQVSTRNISLDANVTALGEMMASPDGRSSRSLSMFVRAGSPSGWLTHAIAQSDDGGDTWGAARLLPIVGASCEGSIGRDATAPAGQVLLASISGRVPFRLGRGNLRCVEKEMTVMLSSSPCPPRSPPPSLHPLSIRHLTPPRPLPQCLHPGHGGGGGGASLPP